MIAEIVGFHIRSTQPTGLCTFLVTIHSQIIAEIVGLNECETQPMGLFTFLFTIHHSPISVILKAVLFDFNGIIIKDDSIHRELIDELLLAENLPPQGKQSRKVSVGKSDRSYLKESLKLRGRFVTDEYLDKLITKKAIAYRQRLEQLEVLPIYPDIVGFIEQMYNCGYKLAVVTGASRSEVELVLKQARIGLYFDEIVAGDEISQSKPDPAGYLLAIARLNKLYPELNLSASECLAIENTLVGLQAAKAAGIQAVAIAHTYPFHMLQRQANWTIDTFTDLELDRLTTFFESVK